MKVARTIVPVVLLFVTSVLAQDLFVVKPGPSLTSQEECQVVFLTAINAVMGGLSRDADEQMQRLTEAYNARMTDPVFQDQLKDCKPPGNVSVDRQNLVVALATCRYRDMLLFEYERDRVPVPGKWAELCQDDD